MFKRLLKCVREFKKPTILTLVFIIGEAIIETFIPFITAALVNKIRPLAANGGKIVVVNNALFLSGKDFLAQLQTLSGEYLSLGEIIPVPDSFIGGSSADSGLLPADPAPFNHPTKIIVFKVRRKAL